MSNPIKYYHSVTQTGEDIVLESHCHSGYELIYVLNGQVAINLEGRNYDLNARNAILIAPLMYHSIKPRNTLLYERIWFEFTAKNIPDEIVDRLNNIIRDDPILIQPENFNLPANVIDELSNAVYAPLLRSYLVQFLYQFAFRAPSTDVRTIHSSNLTVQRIVRYVSEHITQKITLEELSKIAFLSVPNICALFRKEMHISIKQYILQKKMLYAENLMREGNSALFAAQSIGYTNYNNFYTIYTKIMGHAPSCDKMKRMETDV